MSAEPLSAAPVRVLMAVIPGWRIVAASRRQPGDALFWSSIAGSSSTAVPGQPRKERSLVCE